MKKFRLFLWVIVASLAFAACSDDEGEDLGGRYKVTVTTDNNGKAVANPAEAEAGEKITLTATANEGFVFATWTIESGNVTLADATAAETSFTMPKGDVVIRASFAEGVKEYADILPLLQDEIFKEYAQNRMNYPASIEGKSYYAWDLNLDGKLSSAEAAKVTAIDISGTIFQGLQISIEDLQYFPNLEVLVLRGSDIVDGLDVFTKLPKLTNIQADNTATPEGSRIDLSNCPELTTINFEECYLYHLDVSNCPKLAELNINYTDIDELDLSASKLLINIDAGSTLIRSLDLSHCTALQIVHLASCSELTDLKLPNNSRIANLDVYKTNIAKLDATQHPLLSRLSCGGCSNLTALDVTKCSKLTFLSCQYSPVGKLDVSKCPELLELYANCCRLTELNLKGCSKLWNVLCLHNNLTELDASDLGFWVDDRTGELTNSYTLNCGGQVAPGTEPSYRQLDELKFDLWNPLSHELTLYLRGEQMSFWESLKGLNQNHNVKVVEKK